MTPFYFALVLELVVLVYVLLIVPESNPSTQKNTDGSFFKHAETSSSMDFPSSSSPALSSLNVKQPDNFTPSQIPIRDIFMNYFKTSASLFLHPQRLLLSMVFFLIFLSFSGLQYGFVLYTALKFQWNAYDDGLFMLLTSVSRVLYMGLLLPVLHKMWISKASSETEKIKREMILIRMGLIIYAVGFACWGLVENAWAFYLGKSLKFQIVIPKPIFKL